MKFAKAICRYGLLVLMTLAIPALSLLPATFFHHTPPVVRFPHADKAAHVVMYAALAMAFFHALEPQWRAKIRGAIIVIVSVSLYGLVMEIAQSLLTTMRSMEMLDALANTVGALLATLPAYFIARNRARDYKG